MLRSTAAALLALVLAASGAEEIVRGQDRFHFVYRVLLPEFSKPARLWLPLAQTTRAQEVQVDAVKAPGPWQKLTDKSGRNAALFETLEAPPEHAVIEIDYTVSRREEEPYPLSGAVARYLQPERLVPRDETFQSIAARVTAGLVGDRERGRALYQHVIETMSYDKTGAGWGRGDALYACRAGTGNCTDFHAYFIALARAAGLPARFAIGFSIPAAAPEGKIAGYHCWAEFLAAGQWVPVDLSEAWKNRALAEYYFGHRPANRFELSAGRDLEFEPAPASGPFNFLVYPLLEVEGRAIPVQTEFSFQRIAP